MNNTLSFFVIFSFGFVAVFGFFAMSHESEHGHAGCIAALSGGVDCPQGTASFLDFALFHVNAFKNFSVAVLAESFQAASLLFTWLLLIALLVIGRRSGFTATAPDIIFRRAYLQRTFWLPTEYKLIHWLSFHENSPASF